MLWLLLACQGDKAADSVAGDSGLQDSGLQDSALQDSGCDVPFTLYRDMDGDGFGDPSESAERCQPEPGWVADPSDCRDDDALTHPGAAERCDAQDNDCDGVVDEEAIDPNDWFQDIDGDGYGGDVVVTTACDAPEGAYPTAEDCDDARPQAFPGAEERCDGLDDDCDGAVDEDAVDPQTWFSDQDLDGFGAGAEQTGCEPPQASSSTADDCDDGDSARFPGAPEFCDAQANDCDNLGSWSDAQELGEVSWQDPAGRWTSLTGAFNGSASAPASLTLPGSGRLVFCEGTYFAHLAGTPGDLELEGLSGAAFTALDGGGLGQPLHVSGGTLSVDGLTLQGGLGGTGGGLHATNTDLSLRDVQLLNNQATAAGAAIYLAGGSLQMSDCAARNNAAVGDGGAVYIASATGTLTDLTFTNNSATDDGGALLITGSAAVTATNLSMSGHSVGQDGGAVFVSGTSTLSLQGGVIDDNSCNGNGGGVFVAANASANLSQLSVTGNTAGAGGGALAAYTATVSDCDFSDNTDHDVMSLSTGVETDHGAGASFVCDSSGCR